MIRGRGLVGGCCAALAALALMVGAGSASAAAPYPNQDTTVTSFDGAKIQIHFTPANGLLEGQQAPTVLEGSGWSSPAYPRFLGSVGGIDLGPLGSFAGELLGPADLAAAGYNVITWDNRGWYGSGGQVMIDRPSVEGRDVSAILDWLAAQPAAQLDASGDPRVGMTGASYGGGIQLSAAAIDHRIDVITPNMSWYSLMDALYPNETIKSGWGNLLCFAAGITGANTHPTVNDLCASARDGLVTDDEIAFGRASSPAGLIKDIRAPTLLLGGTVDTLFPLAGNVDTYRDLRAAGTPVKMMWYCGGYGLCNQSLGPAGHVLDAQRTFLAKYLKGADVDTGAGFEYLTQDGIWRSAPGYPVAATGRVQGRGSGWLPLSFFNSSGLLGIVATKAANAVTIPITPPKTAVDVTGKPSLTLTYVGGATMGSTSIFAQLVDTTTGKIVGNMATPVPLDLDLGSHTTRLPLDVVSWHLTPSSRLALQLTDSSNLFFGQQAFGLVSLRADVTLPTAPPGAPSAG